MLDRRQVKRTPVSLFVRFNLDEQKDMNFGSFTQDASNEGLKLLSPCRLKLNSILNMNIDIPNDPLLAQAEGSVRWVGSNPLFNENGKLVYPAGVVFTYLDQQDKRFLDEYLAQNLEGTKKINKIL